MTLEDLQAIPLRYTFGYSADGHGLRQYVNAEHAIAKCVYTPRNKKTGEWGTGEATYKTALHTAAPVVASGGWYERLLGWLRA